MSDYTWVTFRYTLGAAAIRDLLFAACEPDGSKRWVADALCDIHKRALEGSENITVTVTWKKKKWVWIPTAHVEWDYEGVHREQNYTGWYGIMRLDVYELYSPDGI